MFARLSTIEKMAVFVATGVFSALTVGFCLGLKFAPTYPDFIVGNIGWDASTKFQDIVLGPAAIIVSFIGLLLFSKLLKNIKEQDGAECSEQLANQLIWWSIPGIACVAALFVQKKINIWILVFSLIPILTISAISFWNYAPKKKTDVESISIFIVSMFFLSLLPVELGILFGRMTNISILNDNGYFYAKISSGFILLVGMMAVLYCGIHKDGIRIKTVKRVIFAGQLGLPFLFLLMYPAKFLFNNGGTAAYSTTWLLKVLVSVFVVAGFFDVVRRYIKPAGNGELKGLFSPVAIFAIIVLLKVGRTLPPEINPDDYHFGEKLLGWWSYSQGVIPYLEYIPAHGIINDDLPQFISSIFYDGTASSLTQSLELSFALVSFMAFLAIFNYSKSLKLSFFIVLLFPTSLNWMFLTIVLCVFFSQTLRQTPVRWLIAWMLLVPVIILAIPGQGLLLVVASGIMVVKMIWIQWRKGDRKSWIAIGITAASILLLAAITPLGTMLFAAIRYVMENGPINQLAYGRTWDETFARNTDKGVLLLSSIQMMWIAVAILFSTVIYSKRKELIDSEGRIYPVVVVFIFVLLLVPYSMGRIDPGSFTSRPFSTSFAAWVILLPLAVWLMLEFVKNKSPLFFLMTCGAALFSGFFVSQISYTRLFSVISPAIRTQALRNGESAGLPNIGNAIVNNEHWDQLTRLNTLLSAKLTPHETYLDLTSRNAQYFYLNRRPVVEVTAPYNMASPSQQQRIVARLAENPPPLALLWVARNINHDGGGLALRNPILYRFVVDNYNPSSEDGFVVGYRKNLSDESIINAAIKNFTDKNWDRGVLRWGSAIILDDSALKAFVEVGGFIRIGGMLRKIREVKGDKLVSVWFEGAPVVLEDVPDRNSIQIITDPQRVNEYNASLFYWAFANSNSNLKKVPVSWGRSAASLQSKMIFAGALDDMPKHYNQVAANDKTYRVTGNDPYVRMDISQLSISGRDAGLLKFDFTCHRQRKEPVIQVFWWGDNHDRPFEASSLKFTAENGTLIVPLDSSPLWLMLNSVKGIRIDLHDASACSAFTLDNMELYQRKF